MVLFVSWQAIPRVPRRILILASEPGGGYHEYGERYAAYLGRAGLQAEVVETRGSLENLERLAYRLLPFWLAGLLTWLAKMLMPFATAALFLYRIVPYSFQFHFGWRVRHFFKRLERLEKARGAGADLEQLRRDLDQLDRDSVNLSVPRGMASPYFEFRQAVHDMRDRLDG